MYLKVKNVRLPYRAGHFTFNPVCHTEIPDERANAMLKTNPEIYERATESEFKRDEGSNVDLVNKLPKIFNRSLPVGKTALVDADGKAVALKTAESDPLKNPDPEQVKAALEDEKAIRAAAIAAAIAAAKEKAAAVRAAEKGTKTK